MNASLARRPAVIAEKRDAVAAFPSPAPHVYSRAWRGAVVLGDVAALGIAFGAAVAIVWHVSGARPSFGACLVASMLLVLGIAAHDLHQKTYALLRRDEFYYGIAVAVICAGAIVPAFFITDMSIATRIAVAVGTLLSGLTIGSVRYLLRRITGDERVFAEPNVEIVAPPLSGIDAWFDEICARKSPTHVVVAEPYVGAPVNDLARAAALRGVVLAIDAKSFAPALAVRGLALSGTTVLEVGVPRIGSPWARRAKRIFDVVVAGLGLVLTAPVLLLAVLAIRFEDGGPAFYTQPRVGRDGVTFSIVKLRSMRVDAEARTGPVWAVNGDARVTRVGRFLRRTSIDELPQLLNVLRGEMSIVGPRPERHVFVERFSAAFPRYRDRFMVAPGLTACSHLYMSRSVESDQVALRLEYDLFYIRHWSLAMDVALLMKTAAEVVFHRAA